jgi:uncharacterized protein (TIGR02271 family)
MDVAQTPPEETVVPVLEERVDVRREPFDVAKVQVRKHVEERVETVAPPVHREEITVERVPVDRWVDAPPGNRLEGDVLVVPLLEEVVVVQKRLRVREELRIRKTLVQEASVPQQVTLQREEVDVERQPLAPPEARRGHTRDA